MTLYCSYHSYSCLCDKADRCDANNARVFSFILVCQLPKDAPHKYDAFLEPLLKEIEDLYIDEEEVFFNEGMNDFPILRVLPLLITADFRAHSVLENTVAVDDVPLQVHVHVQYT